MDTRDPNISMPPGSFGDVDTRDTHAVPGQEKQPYPPPPELGGITSGEVPVLTPYPGAGTGGQVPGDVRRDSDAFQVNAPDHPHDTDAMDDKGEHA
jgi:hypothetical protein